MSDHNPPNKRLKRVEEEPMSDNNTPQIKYDVFVSFRGEIRNGFLSHLIEAFKRSQINAFIDDELKRGDEIWPSLVEAIERSSISLIIFSPDYASSCWCLEEVMKILECREKHGQIVIPVFYKVEPTDVGHQSSESYKNAFVEHARKYETTKVKNWSDALKTSAKISGISSSKFPVDAELVKEIVDLVNLMMKKLVKPAGDSKRLVGIDEKIAAIESLMKKESEHTLLIGIWGMGGLGKTTLAEEVCNKLQSKYDGSCFLANERDQSNKQGIIHLKKIIFSKLLGYNVEIDTLNSLPEDIVRRIGCMKVLIVLDDVNDPDHVEKLLGNLANFGSGSRIIVTTRDKQVLNAIKAHEIYQLQELSSNEALELFNLYVFNQSDHQREYNDLLERVVHYGQGIPLILRVLASLLHGNEKEVWESELNKLKKVPLIKVYDVLEWSYNDLDRKQQQIFLDLACFFLRLHTAVNVGDLTSLLKDGESDNSVIVDLKRLEDRALITFSKDNSLQEMPRGNHRRESSKDNFVYMHDSLQEVAWEIVRRESSEPGSRSRLWDPDDIYEALKNNKGTAAIRSIQIQLSTIKKQKLIPQIFAKMSKLQFLEISGTCNDDLFDQHCILAKGLRFLATELKFLYWDDYPLKSLPKKFSAERLVILSLRHSNMEKLWDGVKNLVNLKEVDLSYSEMLKELPNLSKATNLEELILGGCSMVKALPSSFGHQSKLGLLDLSNSGIERLPSSISNLTQLLYLDVSYCSKLQILPELARSLETLNVRGCGSLKTLPELPRSLENLDVRGCRSLQSLTKLPQSLESLDVRGCGSLQTLPELPRSLETLDVTGCKSLQTLPELPRSLKNLDVTHCKCLQTLPELPRSLETLDVTNCKSIETLPELPLSLKTLDTRLCISLQILPKLPQSLKTLHVKGSESLQTPPELPRSLETLDIIACESIETLPELPQSLKTLNVIGWESLQTLPELPRSLETLDVTNCESIETLPELPRSLETLNVTGCESIETLPELPQSLETLNVCGCKSLQTLPELPRSLETLDVTDCEYIETLPELPQSLETLNVYLCKSLQTLPELPRSLETLDVTHCEYIETLPELPQSLKTLNGNGCKSLQTLPELPQSLETLDVTHCEYIETLPELPQSLKTLNGNGCKSLQTLPELPRSLETLDVTDCESIETLPELPQSLKTLNVNGCKSLQTLLELPWSLENLDAKFCYKLQTLPKLPLSLKTLNVECCSSLQILPKLPLSLEALNVRSCISLKTVLFPSIAVEQLKENRKRVMFWNCLNLDEDSLVAIGLNAQINLMKFANQHLSAPNHDHVENYNDYGYGNNSYQAVYIYPGSSVAEWLEYKTTKDYIIIDLSSPPPFPKLGFIICFVIGKYRATEIYGELEVNLIISDVDGEGKKDSFTMFVYLGFQKIESDNVCVMFHQICSDFLNTIAKNRTSFKIQVQSIRIVSQILPQEVLVLKGFGVSPMSTSAYSSFIQQMELRDSMLQFH